VVAETLNLSRLDGYNTGGRDRASYMYGRDLVPAEMTGIDYYGRLSRAGMLSVRDLALAIVTGDTFLNRLP
jgi:hypothetical protein